MEPRVAGTRGPYRKGIERRKQVVEAAAGVFAKYGYAGGSLRQIAGEVGVTNAALIRLFGSKEALLTAVLEHWSQESVSTMTPATGIDYFRSLVELMEYHKVHRSFNELFLTLALEASNPEHPAHDFFVERYESSLAQFTENLALARRDGDVTLPEALLESEARGLIAIMDGIELQWLLNPNFDLVEQFTYQLDAAMARWTGEPKQIPEDLQVSVPDSA